MFCTLLGIVFVFFLLPETKGKTLEDIEKIFSNKYNADGTLKASVTSIENDGEVNNASSGIEIGADSHSKFSKKSGKYGITNMGFENGVASELSESPNQPAWKPIDSEDEVEDGSLVTRPI